jgi:hypothetical protein
MKKLTNMQKILRVLKSGPKTQADLMRETKVKNTYQIISDAVKKGLLTKENGLVKLNGLPVAVDETTKVSTKEINNVIGRLNPQWPWPSYKVIPMLEAEIKNIDDGIRSLEITKSYLQRRVEEEQRRV